MDCEKVPASGDKEGDKRPGAKTEFRIRTFMDLRRLRCVYLKTGEKPVAVDASDTPLPGESEDDFGLRRSTVEEAWQFYVDSLKEDASPDELTEFLDDQ